MILVNIPAFYYGISPHKVFDYLAAGLPIINNYPGWLVDFICQNKCGVAVPPETAEALASALMALADNLVRRMKFGRNARALAEREFSRDALAGHWVDFVEGVVMCKNSP